MEKVRGVCSNCTEKHCCRGLCREMNNYLVSKRNKSVKLDNKNSRLK